MMVNEQALKNAKNIAELYMVARELKASGEDAGKVNALMAARKKELLQNSGRVASLEKIITKQLPNRNTAMIIPVVKDLCSNKITIRGADNVEM